MCFRINTLRKFHYNKLHKVPVQFPILHNLPPSDSDQNFIKRKDLKKRCPSTYTDLVCENITYHTCPSLIFIPLSFPDTKNRTRSVFRQPYLPFLSPSSSTPNFLLPVWDLTVWTHRFPYHPGSSFNFPYGTPTFLLHAQTLDDLQWPPSHRLTDRVTKPVSPDLQTTYRLTYWKTNPSFSNESC